MTSSLKWTLNIAQKSFVPPNSLGFLPLVFNLLCAVAHSEKIYIPNKLRYYFSSYLI